jgi:UDP-glucuronate decarboxylase
MNKIVQEDLEIISQCNLPWEQFKNSSILVTGASGHICGYIVDTLVYLNEKLKLNLDIIASGRNFNKLEKRFKEYLNKDNFFIDTLNFSNKTLFILPIVDWIIHGASNADPIKYTKNPIDTIKTNTVGIMNLLDYMKPEDYKGFLFLSSGWANGILNETQIPTSEIDYGRLDTMDVTSCYGESKRMGENICASYYQQYGIPTKVARISYAYGPLMDLETDNRAIASFISSIIKNQKIVMNSDGRATRSFCYISDIVTALFTILLKGNNGQVYNASNGTENSIISVIDYLKKYFSVKYNNIEIDLQKDSIFRPNRACLSGNKLKALDWQPKYDLEEGIKRTVESYL